jgi:hypothetical protein
MSSPVKLHPVAPSTPESTRVPSYKFPALDRAEAFPVLTAAQIARIRESGRMRKVELGEILFEPGQSSAMTARTTWSSAKCCAPMNCRCGS